jgi:Ca2+-binding RTX toxin-like protein
VLSEDGRYVGFASSAGNLSGDDGPGWDVFVKDLRTGKVALASIGEGDAQPSDGDSDQPSITGDGRFVAFASSASNLVDGDRNGRADIFVKDLATGDVDMISDAWATDTGPGYSRHPVISNDGRYVLFTRVHVDLIDSDVFLKDRLTGELILINTNAAGDPSDRESKFADFSAMGGRIIFLSYSTDLVPDDTNRRADVFLTTLLSVLEGDSGPNTLRGSAADELIVGLGSADTLHGGPGNDALEGGDGNDRLLCEAGDDVCSGHAGDDTIFAAAGNDSVIGGPGRDFLHGGPGRDTLVGGEGADTLNGFLDPDTLIGGAGADLFVFKAVEHSPFGAGDVILDFLSGTDRIELKDIGPISFIGTSAFVAGNGVIEARFDPAAQQLQVDVNDNGSFGPGDLEINGIGAVAAGDLVL